jgi:hypothetical protein
MGDSDRVRYAYRISPAESDRVHDRIDSAFSLPAARGLKQIVSVVRADVRLKDSPFGRLAARNGHKRHIRDMVLIPSVAIDA